MINFLSDCGISDSVLEEMEKVNSAANIYNLSCNQDEVVKIIRYLNGLGVNCIDKLLVYRIDKFFVTFEDFKNMFVKDDMGSLIETINNDYMVIDEL